MNQQVLVIHGGENFETYEEYLNFLKGGEIYLYHSEDDPVVPFENLALYQAALPHAHARVFHDRGHCMQERFLELENDIKTVS